jgi:hypothetical protein
VLYVHVINLGDDVPGAIKLDERVEVRVVGADRVLLHVDAHHRRRRRHREHVDPRLDVWRSAVLLDKFIEVLDRAAEQLAIGEAANLWHRHNSIQYIFTCAKSWCKGISYLFGNWYIHGYTLAIS